MNKSLLDLMILTTSQDDSIALGALREANVLLKTKNLTWGKVLRLPDLKQSYLSNVELFLRLKTFDLNEKDQTFVDSVKKFFDRTGIITPKQLMALEEIMNRYL